MGIFYYINSVALIEDIPLDEHMVYKDAQDFYTEADRGYTQVCYSFWLIFTKNLFLLAYITLYLFYPNIMPNCPMCIPIGRVLNMYPLKRGEFPADR